MSIEPEPVIDEEPEIDVEIEDIDDTILEGNPDPAPGADHQTA